MPGESLGLIPRMILFLHNRYRTTGGEERVVDDLIWLVREHMGEPAELLSRDSAARSRAGAALGLLRGGLGEAEVADAVRASNARIVHAHNLHPGLGWRSLAAARSVGARVVLHLHQYRLVCATGVCFTRGEECTRCHGRNTLPGVLLNCRASRPEALAYGAALALWQRRLIAQADAVIVPSEFARARLQALGLRLPWDRVRVIPPPVRTLAGAAGAAGAGASAVTSDADAENLTALARTAERSYALVVGRLALEKGVDVAIDACRLAGVPLVIAGYGPEADALHAHAHAAGGDVRFVGHVNAAELARLRAGAAIALVPSRSGETFGMAAAEAMAAAVPVAASRVGALPELIEEDALAPAGDPHELAGAITRLWGDTHAGERGLRRVRELCAPERVAAALTDAYDLAAAE
ncbi:MAG TPA: glycosyltransferase family 4 protein [Solirubrobacteraceae bacterium]|nr:glycosyltransferase family 4 protein [Solirubrobacteraceae bacterium]